MYNHKRLRHNASTAIPRRIVCVDTETQDSIKDGSGKQQDTLWFGHAIQFELDGDGPTLQQVRRIPLTFWSTDHFWQFAADGATDRVTTWICAHNLGFDGTILGTWERMNRGELIVRTPGSRRSRNEEDQLWDGVLLLEDPPTVIGVEDNKGLRFTLVDTLNYWRCSLKELGKSVGLDKIDIDLSTCSVDDAITYCIRDVEIIERAMVSLLRWWTTAEYGKFRWTSPGLAWSAYRHCFYTHPIDFHDSAEIRALERAAYYGGQLEAYYIGEIDEPIYQYDVNSLYPSVMADNLYPVRLMDHSVGPKWTSNELAHNPAYCVAEVMLGPTEETWPCRHEGEVWYVRGPCITTLCGPELAYAFNLNAVQSVGDWAFYLCRPIFTSFVEHFFSEKQRAEDWGDKVGRTFAKLLMNSLYGKFGQRGGRWSVADHRLATQDCGVYFERNLITGQWDKCLSIGNVVLEWKPQQEIVQSFPAISAFVTAYSRQRMRGLRQTAGKGNYYYQSTDSLIVNQVGHNRLVAEGEVGEREMGLLKLECKATCGHIRGLHWYDLGEKSVTGSVKPSAEWTSAVSWKEPHFERLASIIGRGGGAWVTIEQVEKHRNLILRKGRIGLDGWVTPYTGDELGRVLAEDSDVVQVR